MIDTTTLVDFAHQAHERKEMLDNAAAWCAGIAKIEDPFEAVQEIAASTKQASSEFVERIKQGAIDCLRSYLYEQMEEWQSHTANRLEEFSKGVLQGDSPVVETPHMAHAVPQEAVTGGRVAPTPTLGRYHLED